MCVFVCTRRNTVPHLPPFHTGHRFTRKLLFASPPLACVCVCLLTGLMTSLSGATNLEQYGQCVPSSLRKHSLHVSALLRSGHRTTSPMSSASRSRILSNFLNPWGDFFLFGFLVWDGVGEEQRQRQRWGV